jgi:hypothetical protein
VIHPDEETRAAAMRAAPVVAVVRMTGVRLTGDERLVEKPPGTAGPAVTFSSGVWNSGQHGVPRLFRPRPGSIHVVFLIRDGAYWHTVGEYPSYGMPLRAEWVPAIAGAWEAGGVGGGDGGEFADGLWRRVTDESRLVI